jgi:hypothetical protein
MSLRVERAYVDIEPHALASSFDREPFGFSHNLSSLDLFRFSDLQHLTSLYTDRDYFVASGAPTPGTDFYSVAHGDYRPDEAMDRLGSTNARILLKRPENYDRRFRDLLATIFAEIVQRRGGITGKLVRLDSSLLISSSSTITPFHYDPEISFFFQIIGEKDYHIYSPAALREPELEAFYVKGITNIAQVGLAGRDPALEHVFHLGPGKGMHQPRNAPHWVQTHGSIAVSYVVSFETDVTRAQGRTRAFNHYARAAGMTPSPVGRDESADALKAGAMRVAIPVRKSVASTVRRASHRLRR